jgi:hypothetical protein
VTIAAHDHDVTIGNHTHNVTIAAHTHTLTYGIQDDSDYPANIRIAVNGVDRTSALGGPWDAGGSGLDYGDLKVDITEYINDAGTFQQTHTVTISCDSGQGEIECVTELYESIQSLAVA